MNPQTRNLSPNTALAGRLRISLVALITVLLPVLVPWHSAQSQGLGKPAGRVILRVTGAVDCPNTDRGVAFDRETLASIGRHTLITSTPWTDGQKKFEGVLARKLLAAACATGKSVQAKAYNDYTVTIPMLDFKQTDVLLATSMDGEALTLRDKGPVWIIYPATRGGHTREQQNRMVWQLKELIVEP